MFNFRSLWRVQKFYKYRNIPNYVISWFKSLFVVTSSQKKTKFSQILTQTNSLISITGFHSYMYPKALPVRVGHERDMLMSQEERFVRMAPCYDATQMCCSSFFLKFVESIPLK